MFKKFYFSVSIVLTLIMIFNTYASTRRANEAVKECGIYKYEDMPYGKNRERQNFDLYIPENVSGDVNMKLYIHGGAWSSLDKSSELPAVEHDAKCGVVSATVNYRFADKNDKASVNDILNDITSALRKIKAIGQKHNINIKKTLLDGGSAGGHLVLLYAYSRYDEAPIKPALVIAKCPVSDFTDMSLYDGSLHKLDVSKGYIDFPTWKTLLKYMTGEKINKLNIKRKTDALLDISPIKYINENSVPTLIVHGTGDTVVPYSNSVTLDKVLTQYGVDHEFCTYEGAWHDLNPHTNEEEKQFSEAYQRLFEKYWN